MSDTWACLITWTTYGTWLPGDARGWRKRNAGEQLPRPLLEQWCREQMTGAAVLLKHADRGTVEQACRAHADYRGWQLLAVSAQSNHVHVVVATDLEPFKTRDQFKANCTRMLRRQASPLNVPRTWARGGHVSLLNSDESIDLAIKYVTIAQDRKDRHA